jgi:hypothetical protein
MSRKPTAFCRIAAALERIAAHFDEPDPNQQLLQQTIDNQRAHFEERAEAKRKREEWERVEREHMAVCEKRFREREAGQPTSPIALDAVISGVRYTGSVTIDELDVVAEVNSVVEYHVRGRSSNLVAVPV